jgi:GntR family transcriptional regulator
MPASPAKSSKHSIGGGDADGEAVPLRSLLSLSRDTAMPFYQQIEEQVARLIDSGRVPIGATLPAERQLAEALGVSRVTVQSAYQRLRERGLIRGHGRRGSIVEGGDSKLRPDMERLRGFTQEMREAGRTPSTRVLEREIVTDRSMASLFNLGSNARFLRLLRVRLGDDTPLSVESAWYSLDVAPGLETADPAGSMYQQLATEGLSLAYCDQTVEATLPSPAEMEALELTETVPCLLIKRRSYLRNGRMVEYVEGLFRGDAYTYRLRLDA